MADKLTIEVGSVTSSFDLWGELLKETAVLAYTCNIGTTICCTDGSYCWGKLLNTISHR